MRKLGMAVVISLAAVTTVAVAEDQANRSKETKAAPLSDEELDAITAGAAGGAQTFTVISNPGAADLLFAPSPSHHFLSVNGVPLPSDTNGASGLIFISNPAQSFRQICINLSC